MSERKPGRYGVWRYVHDIARDEAINIGVVLETNERRAARFLPDYQKILRRQPDADTEFIDLWVKGYLEYGLGKSLREMSERSVNSFQVTEPRGLLYEDFDRELDELYRRYVEE